jgi:hypothetical protein
MSVQFKRNEINTFIIALYTHVIVNSFELIKVCSVRFGSGL